MFWLWGPAPGAGAGKFLLVPGVSRGEDRNTNRRVLV
jgi:hypothetical protein